MTVTEDARRIVGQHQPVVRRSYGALPYGALVSCTCTQWRGHRDMYPAHVVDALDAAGLLAAPELLQAAAESGATLAGRLRALGDMLVSDVHVDLGPLVREAERLEAQLAHAARLKCEVTRTLGEPPHVRVTWDGVPIAVGYVQGPYGLPLQADNAAPAREPVEDRMRALAADMGDTPLTATILRQFADEVAQLRATITPEGK